MYSILIPLLIRSFLHDWWVVGQQQLAAVSHSCATWQPSHEVCVQPQVAHESMPNDNSHAPHRFATGAFGGLIPRRASLTNK